MFSHSCFIGWLAPGNSFLRFPPILWLLQINIFDIQSSSVLEIWPHPPRIRSVERWRDVMAGLGIEHRLFAGGFRVWMANQPIRSERNYTVFTILHYGKTRIVFAARIGLTLLLFTYKVCWSLVIFATSSLHLILARILAGFGDAGLEQSFVLYIADISDDRIRGALGSVQLLSRSVRYLVAYIAGAIVDYSTFPFIFMGLPIITFLLFVLITNSPQFLMKKGDFEVDELSSIRKAYFH